MPDPLISSDPSSNKENCWLDTNDRCESSFSGEIQKLFHSIWILHFEEIKQRCRSKLCSADRLIHYEEDLANDVMLGIWRELSSTKNHRTFFAMEEIWIAILRLIEERAIDRVKYLRRNRRRCPSQMEPLFDYSAASPDYEFAALLQLEEIETWEALIKLAPNEQYLELLRLKRDGFDVRDISIKFQLNIRSIHRKLHHLRTLYTSSVRA